MVFDFSDAPAKAMAIKELEALADVLTHELIRKINTTFITPFDREDVYALASRLDDVLDLIEAAADRLVLYRIKEPTSGARSLRGVIVKSAPRCRAPWPASGRRARGTCALRRGEPARGAGDRLLKDSSPPCSPT